MSKIYLANECSLCIVLCVEGNQAGDKSNNDDMKTSHTPGPWISEPIAKSADIRIFDSSAEYPSYVATVHRRVYPNGRPYHASDVETDRNARLIAAAPELLAALKPFAQYLENIKGSDNAALLDAAAANIVRNNRELMRSAIAKATT